MAGRLDLLKSLVRSATQASAERLRDLKPVANARKVLEELKARRATLDEQMVSKALARAEGVRYWTHDGREVLDGSAGLFCCAAGHGRREIADAVHAQLMTLDYTPHFQRAAPISFEFATALAGILPEGLDRLFFGGSGSECVAAALGARRVVAFETSEEYFQLMCRRLAAKGVPVPGWTPPADADDADVPATDEHGLPLVRRALGEQVFRRQFFADLVIDQRVGLPIFQAVGPRRLGL